MSARPYDWLLFDADGTLFDYDRAESAALSQAFAQIGAPFPPDGLARYRHINQALWRALEKGELTPGVLKVRRFELLLDSLGVVYPAADFSDRYLRELANCSELLDGAAEVLTALQKDYRCAIVTNGLQAVQRRRLARSSIRHCIAQLIISEEVGCAKPAASFFDVTFARLGHPPKNRVLMIGDSWSSDIEGAARYGLDTCWFNPARHPRPLAPVITREITSLGALLEWLS